MALDNYQKTLSLKSMQPNNPEAGGGEKLYFLFFPASVSCPSSLFDELNKRWFDNMKEYMDRKEERISKKKQAEDDANNGSSSNGGGPPKKTKKS